MNERRKMLIEAMDVLNERERKVLAARRLQKTSNPEELSQEYGISRERVRQIEVRAFEKLQKAMKSAAMNNRIKQEKLLPN